MVWLASFIHYTPERGLVTKMLIITIIEASKSRLLGLIGLVKNYYKRV
jgi:hypothetical protein